MVRPLVAQKRGRWGGDGFGEGDGDEVVPSADDAALVCVAGRTAWADVLEVFDPIVDRRAQVLLVQPGDICPEACCRLAR